MRTAFIQELVALGRKHPEIFLVVGDLGYSVVEPFAEEFPDRFLNAGVAEQNMTGVAAGLASEGYHVFTYSIANFPTLRCFEQIRNDVCYHGLAVTVVAVGAGLAYGNLGYSHHAVQDIAVMASLPDMHVYSPADPHETRLCLRHLVQHPRPSYLRLGKAGEPELHKVDGIASGPLRVREGRDGPAIVTTGSCLSIALETADRMSEEIASPSVYSCPLLSEPSGFYSPLWQHSDIITVEEHTAIGGLGDLLRRVAPVGITIKSLSLSGELAAESGSQRSLWTKHGITVSNLTDLIRRRQP